MLGERVVYGQAVEILIVGGAAGVLIGVLRPGRTTADCDVMVYAPAKAMGAVELAAERVAMELGFSGNWLNSDAQLRRDTLPDGWEGRRHHLGDHGNLRVYALSRLDLFAMKVVAGRPQDLDDLEAMKVRQEELRFVRDHLTRLEAPGNRSGADRRCEGATR